ncbi:class I SAM-dependent methyltransferase [Sphingobacterium sp. LRF_L2]|uniref:class I SAM-dependent methyltransferase n=1 Tax=Sphingobacterium sp. LRF_L2 TaxID=3369421 RepID=UPI003F6065D1
MKEKDLMTEIWESTFQEHQALWGFSPTLSAKLAKDFFLEKNVKNILIPGIGYGRNAKLFIDHGIEVTGIEISKTAIEMAHTYYGSQMKIHEGSVTSMPFDDAIYDGIFCYGLLYLLDKNQRAKFLENCFRQLKKGGFMFFSVISKNSPNYGKGLQVDEDTFEVTKGARVFFYDLEAIKEEFQTYGLIDFIEVEEIANPEKPNVKFNFFTVYCRKGT